MRLPLVMSMFHMLLTTPETYWPHEGGNLVAKRCSLEGASFCGGSHRRDPTGGSAKGMARNWRVWGNSGSTRPV
ncbi:hypothetical protein B0I35DRAFT_443518 [Stachybotrys elegans]|uniref:Secreted protein n=1 Tax=Stachybotrys elegans TaxID=80388 RepID=A0A8K0SJP8_9HYPO|nr:hypothetical protein B0I35DRAFT_443518 [Stachybotrys elegans]